MNRAGWSAFSMACLGLLLLLGPVHRGSAQVMGQAKYLLVLVDQFEHAPGLSGRPIRLGADAWYGGNYNRLVIKIDGDAGTRGGEREVEGQLLFGRMVAPYWDLQVGLRVDGAWDDESRTRTHLALGCQGLAPYWFEVETALFLSMEGDVSATVQASYDLLLTQRLVLQPEIEANASFQDVSEWGLASGLNDTELALRLRYEIRREFAPYVGYAWRKAYGGTRDLLRESGDQVHRGTLVAGVRMWY